MLDEVIDINLKYLRYIYCNKKAVSLEKILMFGKLKSDGKRSQHETRLQNATTSDTSISVEKFGKSYR